MGRKKNKIWVQFNRVGAIVRKIKTIGFQHDHEKEALDIANKLEDISRELRAEVKRRQDAEETKTKM